MTKCPTCGRSMPTAHRLDSEELLALLRDEAPRRCVYVGQDGGWWVTYGGGETSHEAVQILLDRGLIRRKYLDLDGCFYMGRTIDMVATGEGRKRYGRAAPIVYVTD